MVPFRHVVIALGFATLGMGTGFAQVPLIQDGSFESGSFSSWVQSGNTEFTSILSQAYYGVAAEAGSHYALLGPVGSDGELSQSFADQAGKALQVSFWLASDGDIPNDFTARFDGTSLVSLADTGRFGWTEYEANVIGTGEDTLSFSFRDDPGYLSLDNVAVAQGSPIPEPATLAMLPIGLLALTRLRRK